MNGNTAGEPSIIEWFETYEQEIALEEIIRKVVREMDEDGFFDHSHNKQTGEME